MQSTAVRLHGACDLRMSTFELPEITADEALMRVVSDSLCASTYKAYKQGSAHKRVPNDIDTHPVIVGHEMSGELVAVGANPAADWKVGDRVIIQPALKLANWYDPGSGYSYPYICGLPQYADAVREMEKSSGAKKICYNHIDLPMTAVDDLAELGKTDPLMAKLAELVAAHGGLWNAEAEAYLLANAKKVDA